MGNTDSVFSKLVLGNEVEDEKLKEDEFIADKALSALLWGEAADEVDPTPRPRTLGPPLPDRYRRLEEMHLPDSWEELEVIVKMFCTATDVFLVIVNRMYSTVGSVGG